MKIKVLTVLNKLNLGGIEKTLLTSLNLFKKHNIEIHILSSSGGCLDREYEKNGAILHTFNKSRNPLYDAISLYQLLKEENFDIVHSRDGHTSGFLCLACKLASTPILVSIHNEKSNFKIDWKKSIIKSKFRNTYLSIHKKITLKYSSKIIGHSKANLAYYNYNDTLSNKFKLIYNGVDFSKFEDESQIVINEDIESFMKNSKMVFLHIGSFRYQKNHSFLIDVFSELNPVKNKYKLILVGEGGLRHKMMEKVRLLGLKEYVYFTGLDLNIEYLLKKSDLFLFPSVHEGFGNVLIEAQYNKLIIAASRIKPHLESVYSGYHSYLFDPLDVEDAVSKIQTLIQDNRKAEFKQIKDAAFMFSKDFSIESMTFKLFESYFEVLESKT